jgi:hypothetical protein
MTDWLFDNILPLSVQLKIKYSGINHQQKLRKEGKNRRIAAFF